MHHLRSLTLLLFLPAISLAVPPTPAPPQDHPIALVGGTVHPVGEADIADGVVLFEGGKITAIGKTVKLPAKCEKIDVKGKHVYPGLMDSYTQLGLSEISAVRATNDIREAGVINPNARALVAVNPDSELIPVARTNGITHVITAPEGGIMAGLSACIQLDGWTWEEMSLQSPAALHIDWPNTEENFKKLQQAFDDARNYQKAKLANPALPQDIRWEAMLPVIDGKVPMVAHADLAEGIQEAVAFCQREKLRLIIHGGYDAEQCADLLKQHNVPIIVDGVHRLPFRRDDPYDTPFTLPARLHKAGVRFCIAGNDRAGNVRNLPYHAGLAAAYGLPKAEALKSITLYPAEIFSLSTLGSLSLGKSATLIVTTGDPLDIRTQVEMSFIQGRRLTLNDKQQDLYRKYQEKYRRLEPAK